MLHLSFARRAYLIVTLLFVGAYFVCAHIYLEEKREILIQKRYLELFQAISNVERNFDINQFDAKVREVSALDVPQDEKVKILNQLYQPLLEEVSAQIPGGGIALYSVELDGIIAVDSNIVQEFLQSVHTPKILNGYDEQKLENRKKDSGDDYWEGKENLNVNHPITLKRETVGFIWVTSAKEDIEREIVRFLLNLRILFISCWLLFLFAFILLIRRLQNVMLVLATKVKMDDYDPAIFKSFPRLKPFFDTLIELKESLKLEYMEREMLNSKMAKVSKLTLISEMAASVAHEVRNPMTVIHGYIQFMMKKATTTERVKFELIITEINRINSLITEFLLLAKDKRVNKEKRNVNEIVQNVYPLINTEALRHSAEILLNLADEIPPVLLDEKEFVQLTLHLCKNAIDAMEGKKGILLIQTHKVESGVELMIADNGCGIPGQDLDRIFDPFYTTRDEGTGLGLAVCRSIVLRHGGEMAVTSTMGVGTIFRVTFPE